MSERFHFVFTYAGCDNVTSKVFHKHDVCANRMCCQETTLQMGQRLWQNNSFATAEQIMIAESHLQSLNQPLMVVPAS